MYQEFFLDIFNTSVGRLGLVLHANVLETYAWRQWQGQKIKQL